jgi:hypothetical protein
MALTITTTASFITYLDYVPPSLRAAGCHLALLRYLRFSPKIFRRNFRGWLKTGLKQGLNVSGLT